MMNKLITEKYAPSGRKHYSLHFVICPPSSHELHVRQTKLFSSEVVQLRRGGSVSRPFPPCNSTTTLSGRGHRHDERIQFYNIW